MTNSSVPQVELFDTSLRDGMQQPNLEISVPGAVSLLQRMSAFGVHYAEIGFAGAHQFVGDLTHALENTDTGALRLALFGRSRGRGTRARTLDYSHQVVAQGAEQQVGRIVVCDTTGGASPEEVSGVVGTLVRNHPNTRIGFHGHTDRGLGVANSRAAIIAGASHVQGTLLGTGERCGNVNLTTLVGSMQLRGEAEFVPAISLVGLTSLLHSAYAEFS